MSGLPILEVKKPKQTPDTAPNPLPSHAFLWGFVAPPRSGKSNALMTLIGASHMYGRDYFDEIYMLSPSQKFDNSTRHVLPKLDNVVQIDDPDTLDNADVIVRAIMKQQADDPPEERKKVLIIFTGKIKRKRLDSIKLYFLNMFLRKLQLIKEVLIII